MERTGREAERQSMRGSKRAMAAGVATLLASATTGAAPPALQPFDSPAAALQSLLSQKPRVIAFGEYHEIEGAARVRSSLDHFLAELFPSLTSLASDLILETW